MVASVTAAACKELYPLPFDVDKFKYDFATLMAKLEGCSFDEESNCENMPDPKLEHTEDNDGIMAQIETYRKKPNRINLAVTTAVTVAFSAIAVTACCLYRAVKR